ncbi:hypothetical protein DENSPDRAFT_832691 [Dentipellis sp. KUC8613]|nr:hypothetical protein DENSPDRAFT_832691 [Dentipellis sp. KUC8613]
MNDYLSVFVLPLPHAFSPADSSVCPRWSARGCACCPTNAQTTRLIMACRRAWQQRVRSHPDQIWRAGPGPHAPCGDPAVPGPVPTVAPLESASGSGSTRPADTLVYDLLRP